MDELITIPNESALAIYTTENAIDPYLDRVRAEVEAFIEKGVSADTAAGRKEIGSFAYRVARTKSALEKVGKDLADDVKSIPKKVDATRRHVRTTLESWADEVRRPLTEWEEADTKRIAEHEELLASLVEPPEYGMTETAQEIRDRLTWLMEYPARDWQEFAAQARQTFADEIGRIKTLLAAAEKREAEAAELARLRAEAAAREAAERAAEEARQEEERKRQEAERLRLAAEVAAEAERQRAEQAAAAERERAEQERQRIEQEKADAIARAERAERDRIAAEEAAAERERLAAEQAERDRQAAAEKAEQDRLAAIEAERQRQDEEKAREAREAAEREADKMHRAKINNAAKSALIFAGLSEKDATTAIVAIAKGEVPGIKILY